MVLRLARRPSNPMVGPEIGPSVVAAMLTASLATSLGLAACGRTDLAFSNADTEASSQGTTGDPTDGTTTRPGLDTGRPGDTGRPETTGPITITDTFPTGADSGVLDTGWFDTGPDDTGFPGTTTTGPGTTTTGPGTSTTDPSTTGPDPSTTDPSTTGPGTSTTDGGTTDGGTTGGTTDGGTTGGTTDGGTTDGGTTGGDPTCLDAVDCVIACGGPSPGCINACDDGLPPGENGDFLALESCIIFACIFNGSCAPGGFGQPACVACRLDGQLDPTTVGCEDEAMTCAM